MDILTAVIFGIVEGITEFLPVSSTGHLILTGRLLGFSQTDFLKSFEIVIQLGAILAVIVLYGKSFLIDGAVIKRVLTAFFPTAVVGLIFYKTVRSVLLGNNQIVLCSLFLGGIFLILFELVYREDNRTVEELHLISYRKAFLIGVFQSVAMIPGISRAAATIIGGLMLGLKRKTIVEFSFLLAIPTMCAATGLDLLKYAHTFAPPQLTYLTVGFVTSFMMAGIGIKFLLHFIKNHNFIVFGMYRIIIALFFWFIVRS